MTVPTSSSRVSVCAALTCCLIIPAISSALIMPSLCLSVGRQRLLEVFDRQQVAALSFELARNARVGVAVADFHDRAAQELGDDLGLRDERAPVDLGQT